MNLADLYVEWVWFQIYKLYFESRLEFKITAITPCFRDPAGRTAPEVIRGDLEF